MKTDSEKLDELLHALGAEDLENWEDVLLLARGIYFNDGERDITMQSQDFEIQSLRAENERLKRLVK